MKMNNRKTNNKRKINNRKTKKYNKISKSKSRKNYKNKKYFYRKTKKIGGDIEETRRQMETMLANPETRYANVLNVICGPSTRGECVDFGSYKNEINRYFKNFNINENAQYIDYIKKIGMDSNNGAVCEIKFTKNNYSAFAVIKLNLQSRSDNLVYEHFVGKTFINKYLNIFPCFVETYNMYMVVKMKTPMLINRIETSINPNVTNIMGNKIDYYFKIIPDKYEFPIDQIAKKACRHGKANNLGILIQHYDNFKNITDSAGSNLSELYPLLFQVYFSLHCMKNNFTHYDLHIGNALGYKPYVGNKYVEMNYHFNDGSIIRFPTERIMKIIDYGRSHFNHQVNGQTENTKMIIDTLCANTSEPKYNQDACYSTDGQDEYFCGEEYGMSSIFGENEFIKDQNRHIKNKGSFFNIDPDTRNVSHDLRLLYIINKVKKLKMPIKYDDDFGTPEYENVTYDGSTNITIKNVTDAVLYLKDKLNGVNSNPGVISENFIEWSTNTPSPDVNYNKYGTSEGWEKMGEFHIYEDQRDYEFIPTQTT